MPAGAGDGLRARAADAGPPGGGVPVFGRPSRQRGGGADPAHGTVAGVPGASVRGGRPPIRVARGSRTDYENPHVEARSISTSTISDDPSSIGDDDSYCVNFSYSRFRSRTNSIPVSMK